MRLVQSSNPNVWEVHHLDRMIGQIWVYQGEWHGELKSGEPVHLAAALSRRQAGLQVEAAYKASESG